MSVVDKSSQTHKDGCHSLFFNYIVNHLSWFLMHKLIFTSFYIFKLLLVLFLNTKKLTEFLSLIMDIFYKKKKNLGLVLYWLRPCYKELVQTDRWMGTNRLWLESWLRLKQSFFLNIWFQETWNQSMGPFHFRFYLKFSSSIKYFP